jgi:hypothetical protein
VILDNADIRDADYRVWRPRYDRHAYRGIQFPQKAIAGLGSDASSDERQFPKPLDPVDDLPPVTVVTHVTRANGKLVVRGTTADNGEMKAVTVNGQPATATAGNFAQWQVELVDANVDRITAAAEDAAGTAEKSPHVLRPPGGTGR